LPDARKHAERLFLEGFGTAKVSLRTGVSKTVCTRIRSKLVARLKRKSECLPGCYSNGKRHTMRDHARHVPEELKTKFKSLIMQRVPVRRACLMAGIGSCTGYKLRDQMKAEGLDVPRPRLPGKTNALRREMLYGQVIPEGQMWRYRQLVRETGSADAARAALRAEMVSAKGNRTFEDQLQLVASGKASLSRTIRIRPVEHDFTLGGVTGAIL
jgi:hypothetical protein